MATRTTSNLLIVCCISLVCSTRYLTDANYLPDNPTSYNYHQQAPTFLEAQAPVIAPFIFNQIVQEGQRSSVLCAIQSGDVPVTITWLKDGNPLTQAISQAKKIVIKPDSDQSTLKFSSVRLEHAGNYTCVARNRAGTAAHSSQLVVQGEPRWLREPQHEPIVAIRGQTVVIDCLTTGWPKPMQSWLIKTHMQSDFEQLVPTGRISLAANGSLVIRNADKSDEANYLCKSSNGIGKGISWSTSLKVNVPAHFGPNKQLTSVVRKSNQIQLRCDAFGDEPISIEWYKNKQRLTNDANLDSRFSIHNQILHNGLISALVIKQSQRQDNSHYECVARNPVGKDRLQIELLVQEEPDNIQEIQATQINSRSVTLMWNEPYDGRTPITNYMFQYKKVQHESAMPSSLADIESIEQADSASTNGDALLSLKPASSTIDDWQQALRLTLPVAVSSGGGGNSNGSSTSPIIKSITIDRLDPSSKYVLRALAINSIGQSKFSQPMEFTTEEEAPEVGPTHIRAVAINSTSIKVSWDEIPKSKLLGRIHGYYIGHRVANMNSSAQNFIYKPYLINDLVQQQVQQQSTQATQQDNPQSAYSHMNSMASSMNSRLEFVIHDLRRDTNYEITVVAFNSRGSGPLSDFVSCKTIEMEAPKPVMLQIRRESNESIFIEWQRDPSDQNPVDDYVLYQEKNSASQEWLQVRLPGNQTQYKAPGLKCGTRYQFYIVAHNKVGKSAQSETVSASTSGSLPQIPTKMNLLKMVNSTCLMVNLNSFQDSGCRIKTFTVRYRIDKAAVGNSNGSPTLIGSNGVAASTAALTVGQANSKMSLMNSAGSGGSSSMQSDWITIRPKSNIKHQRANEEDRMEYLCDLNPDGEYTIHVAASNDVGRSEIEYSVSMASDELRHSLLREVMEAISNVPNVLSFIPSIIIFLLAGLLLCIASLILYTTAVKYYDKFVIMQNQMRATRRAKQDEKRRRNLNQGSRQNQKLDLWAEEYEVDEEEEDDDDMADEDDSSASSGNAIASSARQHFANNRRAAANGHYLGNIAANSAFDTSSIDSPCRKFGSGGSTCMSTASTDSLTQGRFQCLNSKQYVKMNEYSMLPPIQTISSSVSPVNQDIYGTTVARQAMARPNPAAAASNNSLYYSTLRRTNMQTYVPTQSRGAPMQQSSPQQQQQHHLHQQHLRQSQNTMNDIYGYYVTPHTQVNRTSPIQQAANESANSIFVPPRQMMYSAPNIRHQPVYL